MPPAHERRVTLDKSSKINGRGGDDLEERKSGSVHDAAFIRAEI